MRYDIEGEVGPLWTTIRFGGAIAMRVLPEPAVPALLVSAYSQVAEIDNSAWLVALGRESSGQGIRLAADARHFAIFFDHFGSLEVIARSCDLA